MQNLKHEVWTAATVAALLKLRLWAIRYDTSPLKAWDMLSERMRLASRRATSVQDWVSTIMRTMRIGTVDVDGSGVFVELAAVVGDEADEWLTWVGDEHQFLFAVARLQADKKSKKAKA